MSTVWAVLFLLVLMGVAAGVVWLEATGRTALRKALRRYWAGESLDDGPDWMAASAAPPAPAEPPRRVAAPQPTPAALAPPKAPAAIPSGSPVELARSRTPSPDTAPRALPPVDIDRDALKKRYQPSKERPADAAPLPTIELSELRDNLSNAWRQQRRRRAPLGGDTARQGDALPLVDPNEVKASLRQLHGHRLKGAAPESSVSRILAREAAPAGKPAPVVPLRTQPSRTATSTPRPAPSAAHTPASPPSRPAAAATAPIAPQPGFAEKMREARAEQLKPAPPEAATAVAAPLPLIESAAGAAQPLERPAAERAEQVEAATVNASDAAGSANPSPDIPIDAPHSAVSAPQKPPSLEAASVPGPAATDAAAKAVTVAPLDVPPPAEAAAVPVAHIAAPAVEPPATTLAEPAPATAPTLPWTLIEEKPAATQATSPRPLAWTLIDDDTESPRGATPPDETPPVAAPQTEPTPAEPPAPQQHAALPVVYGDACLPPLELLQPASAAQEACSQDMLIERGIVIEEKCAEFKVKVSVVDAYAGPVITRYEVEPAVGVRGNQVVNLMKDLSRALGLASIRVVETIPGKTCMGLELPNPVRQMIRLSEILSAEVFQGSNSLLTMALGKDITGEPVVMDLAKAPHLLVAGTTGSGKSVGVNAMILSLLYKASPDQVRFIMIDPKMLELSVYNDIPHLLAPVVTDMKLAANALNWCVGEMERRYRLMSALGVRNLAGYNEKVLKAEEDGRRLSNPFTLTPDNPEPLAPLPFIVVVVDEFADLMMVAGKKIEELIAQLAQKARAAGIHLILATQRPSVDVITGLIKANIPTRIAFQVSSKVDSRTILDQMGAESLLGQGDMLFLPPGTGYPQRVHGAFVTDAEVHAVVEHLKQFGEPDYVEGLLTGEAEADEESAAAAQSGRGASEADPLYDEAVEIVMRTRKASISSVQRHLRIGYNRAARLIEQMEEAGLVSAMESNGNRTVLVPERTY
ncbi:S-DNA-T family DNA segregation ATPase FtsK/SpoIIIE [Crenobacter luteus]|uniref:DNA translocase FtsK n=1 Tax=Crenobacter luteus TaxID=1452487 RepID=UPI0010DE6458|nr:DNA translocase FtsK [Crenobacter luteus]TCP09419.1 S-DNA-T family DNA segregation ATPase FtsK/SpoIIIE [Crenobacter luteus]